MKKQVKTMAFLCHPSKIEVPPLLKTVIEWANENNIGVKLTPRMAKSLGKPELGSPRQDMVNEIDLVVVLGGDGSILETVRAFASDGIPIAGINIGHLGFLTLDEPKNAIQTLNKLKNGKFRIENRMMLQATVWRNGKKIFRGIALNDVVIQKGTMLRVINIDVSISGNKVSRYHGDGLIFSTPTGTTAYNLSAGGPIVPPWVNVITLCPLNCHTLNARPVVTTDQEIITAKLVCVHSKVDLVMDGQEGFRLQNEDEVEISRAQELGRIVILKPRRFFHVLRKKLNWS